MLRKMLTPVTQLPPPFRDQVREIAILVLAILGMAFVGKLAAVCLGEELVLNLHWLKIRYAFQIAELAFFIRVIVVAFKR